MQAQPQQAPVYTQYVDEIIGTFAQEMKEELGMLCIGDGGRMPRVVEEIAARFIAYQRASIKEARELEIKATERLLNIINAHEKIRPYLKEYPFKSNRADVTIAFYKKENRYFTDQSVAYVCTGKGKIHYFSAEPETDKLIDLHEESYEEALRIVHKGF